MSWPIVVLLDAAVRMVLLVGGLAIGAAVLAACEATLRSDGQPLVGVEVKRSGSSSSRLPSSPPADNPSSPTGS